MLAHWRRQWRSIVVLTQHPGTARLMMVVATAACPWREQREGSADGQSHARDGRESGCGCICSHGTITLLSLTSEFPPSLRSPVSASALAMFQQLLRDLVSLDALLHPLSSSLRVAACMQPSHHALSATGTGNHSTSPSLISAKRRVLDFAVSYV